MTFIGDKEGWPAPRLKDSDFSEDEAPILYDECIKLLRRLYQECRLVHADFSEYNLLHHEGHIVVIDVSQSVEVEHPHALEFLRMDCMNILKFFRGKGLKTLCLQRLFDFIVKKDIEDVDAHLFEAHATIVEFDDQESEEINPEDKDKDAFTLKYRQAQGERFKRNEEEIFKNSYIPRTLDEVYDAERDVELVRKGRADELIYQRFAGLTVKDSKEESEGDSDNFCDSDNLDESDESEYYSTFSTSTSTSSYSSSNSNSNLRLKEMSPEDRKAWRKANKLAVKEEKKERRKTKLKKHIKKRKTKKVGIK